METKKYILYETRFGFTKSFFLWLMTAIHIGIIIPHQIFQMWKFGNFQEFNCLIVIWFCAVCGLIILGIFLLHLDEVLIMINFILVYVKTFEQNFVNTSNYCSENSKENQQLLRLLRSAGFLQFTFVTVFIAHHIIYPIWPFYLTSEIPRRLFNATFYIGFGIIYGWAVTGIGLLILLGLFVVLFYYVHFIPILKNEFALGREFQALGNRKSKDSLRQVDNFIKMYRALNIIIQVQNQCTSIGILPLQFCVWFLGMFCFLTLNQQWNYLGHVEKGVMMLFGLTYVLTWTTVLKLFGNISMTNRKTRQSWKSAEVQKILSSDEFKKRQYMKRFRRSCRPLCVGYGNFFVTKPVSVLNFLRMLSRGLLKSLIAARKVSWMQSNW